MQWWRTPKSRIDRLVGIGMPDGIWRCRSQVQPSAVSKRPELSGDKSGILPSAFFFSHVSPHGNLHSMIRPGSGTDRYCLDFGCSARYRRHYVQIIKREQLSLLPMFKFRRHALRMGYVNSTLGGGLQLVEGWNPSVPKI